VNLWGGAIHKPTCFQCLGMTFGKWRTSEKGNFEGGTRETKHSLSCEEMGVFSC
jgi:hypothetical protein